MEEMAEFQVPVAVEPDMEAEAADNIEEDVAEILGEDDSWVKIPEIPLDNEQREIQEARKRVTIVPVI
jgi:hypothetical protein